jgi:hypothetical protein
VTEGIEWIFIGDPLDDHPEVALHYLSCDLHGPHAFSSASMLPDSNAGIEK